MYTIDKKRFGTFVAELRKEKGYTQKELASELFISDKAVSKWETGASIPDTALLIPLATLLDVSVTELLLCRRNSTENLTPAEAEQAVQTAIGYDGHPSMRVWQTGSRIPVWYLGALLVTVMGSMVNIHFGFGNWDYFTYIGLYTFFGGYFCLLALQKLPAIYDQSAIPFLSDGIVRMNLPGVHFSNQNWPALLRTGQIWGISSLLVFPWLHLGLHLLPLSVLWVRYICLAVTLCGLFLPLYIVGKKYEK